MTPASQPNPEHNPDRSREDVGFSELLGPAATVITVSKRYLNPEVPTEISLNALGQDAARVCVEALQMLRGKGGQYISSPFESVQLLFKNWLGSVSGLNVDLPVENHVRYIRKHLPTPAPDHTELTNVAQLQDAIARQQYAAIDQMLGFTGRAFDRLVKSDRAERGAGLRMFLAQAGLEPDRVELLNVAQLLECVLVGVGARLAARTTGIDSIRKFAAHADKEGLSFFYETLVAEWDSLLLFARASEDPYLDISDDNRGIMQNAGMLCLTLLHLQSSALFIYALRHYGSSKQSDSYKLPVPREAVSLLSGSRFAQYVAGLSMSVGGESLSEGLRGLSGHHQFVAQLLTAAAGGIADSQDLRVLQERFRTQLGDRGLGRTLLSSLVVQAEESLLTVDMGAATPVALRFASRDW